MSRAPSKSRKLALRASRAQRSRACPFPDVASLRRAYQFSNLQSFLDLYYACMAVLRTEEDFRDLAAAYLTRARADGVVRAEMFFDPQAHLDRGVPLASVIAGLTTAAREAALAGGPTVGLIACLLRDHGPASALETVEALAGYRDALTGIGLDSAELGYPPADYAAAFELAGQLGLRKVAHAGEEGPPDFVWQAIDVLGAERIDHGIRSVEDKALLRRLAADQTPLTGLPAVQRPAEGRAEPGGAPASRAPRRGRARHDQLRRPGVLRRVRRRQLPRRGGRVRPRGSGPAFPGGSLPGRLLPLVPGSLAGLAGGEGRAGRVGDIAAQGLPAIRQRAGVEARHFIIGGLLYPVASAEMNPIGRVRSGHRELTRGHTGVTRDGIEVEGRRGRPARCGLDAEPEPARPWEQV